MGAAYAATASDELAQPDIDFLERISWEYAQDDLRARSGIAKPLAQRVKPQIGRPPAIHGDDGVAGLEPTSVDMSVITSRTSTGPIVISDARVTCAREAPCRQGEGPHPESESSDCRGEA
ncbi:MAG: hypothetical protein ACYDAE_20265, partial [Steroidobacteraceae bacterium]